MRRSTGPLFGGQDGGRGFQEEKGLFGPGIVELFDAVPSRQLDISVKMDLT